MGTGWPGIPQGYPCYSLSDLSRSLKALGWICASWYHFLSCYHLFLFLNFCFVLLHVFICLAFRYPTFFDFFLLFSLLWLVSLPFFFCVQMTRTSSKGGGRMEQWGVTSGSHDPLDRFRSCVRRPDLNPSAIPWACDLLGIPCTFPIYIYIYY